MVVRSLSYVLGAIFLIAGISKLFVLDAFAATVAAITLLPLGRALILAIGIIGAEILGAIALFAQFKIRMVSVMFCALVAVFVWILSSAVVLGQEITCNCFGNLGLRMTNTQEFFFDIALFNAFALLAYYSPGRERVSLAGRGKKGQQWKSILAVLLVLLDVSVVMPVLNGGKAGTHLRPQAAIGFAERAHPQFVQHIAGNRALFLMKYADLGCPLCFEDFIAFAESAKFTLGMSSHQALMIFDEDQFVRNDSSRHLQRWVSANGIPFPVIVAPDSVLGSIGLEKSMVIILDRKNTMLFAERFPMGATKRLLAIQLLHPDAGGDASLSR